MATLEIHDGHGQVRRIDITRAQPILFGSSSKCDVVLDGEGIYPFHGRLRWKGSRYKADASPDAGHLVVNGQKLASSSIRQGDEIAVGPCRIFLLFDDEDQAEDDATRIQPIPISSSPPASAPPKRKGAIEREDWHRDMDVAPPSVEGAVARPVLPRRGSRRRPSSEGADELAETSGRRRDPFTTRTPGRSLFKGAAPGQERVLTSPLALGLALTLIVLVVLGFVLRGIITRTVTARLYQRAVESYDDGDYRNAIRNFDEALKAGRLDGSERGKAVVLRAMANVRQYTSTTGASWSNALEAAREMIATAGKEPSYRDSSPDLADLVIRAGEALADRARQSSDARALAEAESAIPLHAAVAGKGAEGLLARSRLPAKLAEARAAVRKQAIKGVAIAAMDEALSGRSSKRVFEARDGLVRQYPDLAGDREVVPRVRRALDLIREAVTFDSSRRPAETEPRREPLGPPTTLVLRSAGAPDPKGKGEGPLAFAFALADGLAYGLDGASGAPLWQAPVGASAPFPPQRVPGGTTVLVFDARHEELLRLDARDGTLKWRQRLESGVKAPPLLLGNQVIQPTRDGSLALIDLASGEIRGRLRLGMPLATTPACDEGGQFLYVPADADSLFVVSRDPPACTAVEYLGQGPGSVACPPARLGRYLVVPENRDLLEGLWRVFLLEEDGAKVREVQQVPIPGWTWDTPASAGSVLWAVGDRGGIAALGVGAEQAKVPFHPIARLNAETRPTGPAFALAKTETDLWLSSGRPGRYELDLEKGSIRNAWRLGDAGPALAPIQVAGDLAVLTHQSAGRPGVALWGIDPRAGTTRWRTVLGAAWIAPPRVQSDGSLATWGANGDALTIPPSSSPRPRFLEEPIPEAGAFHLPRGPLQILERPGTTLIVSGPGSRNFLASRDRGRYLAVDLPVATGAAPLLWGRDLLIPGADGRAYLIDPDTGESRAEPLVPPFDRDHPTRWRDPCPLGEDAVILTDRSGRMRRLTVVKDPRPRLVATAEAGLGKDIAAGPVTTTTAVVVATSDGRVRSLSARDLSPVGAWPIESPTTTSLHVVGDLVVAGDRDGRVMAFGPDGSRLWAVTLDGGELAGSPVARDDSLWLLTVDGTLERRSRRDGSPLDRQRLGILPAGGLQALGSGLLVPTAGGTLQVWNSGGGRE